MKHRLFSTIFSISCGIALGSTFPAGSRIGFVGDSLTSQGGYHQAISLYYLTRFPKRTITTCNFGISGDRAAGCAKRYEWDIKPFHATVLTLTTGVNDVNRGLYADTVPDDTIQARRLEAIQTHIQGTEDFILKAQADGATVIVMSPALFDQTADIAAPKQTGINDSLRIMSEADRKTAAKYGCQFIDLNTPMMAINARGQQDDPSFTIVGADRIHPQAPGHLIMAYLILKAQNAPATVASVTLDAVNATRRALDNCTLSQVKLSKDAIQFIYNANALPFPYEQNQLPALKLVPFQESFNNEIIRIRNLQPGNYEIVIDDKTVQTVTAEQLAEGVNLASNNRTPQHKQAMAVRDLLKKRENIRGKLKIHTLLKQQFFADRHDLDWKQEKVILEDVYTKLGKDTVWNNYRSVCIEQYMEIGPQREKLVQQYDSLTQQLYVINQPTAHNVVIRLK